MTMRRTPMPQHGFSIVELMIAMTLGLFLLAGLTLIFVNSSRTNKEMAKTAQQIENGRYAIDMLTQDLRLAGFYGHLSTMPTAPASADPCETASTTNMYNALAWHVQGYRAADMSSRPDLSTTTCITKGLLTNANLKVGSDVLVIRRANTSVLATTDVATSNEVYIQATSSQADIQLGNGAVIGTNTAAGAASTLKLKDTVTPAPIRKYHVHVYFVAPCSVGSGTNGICTGSDDTIPTLKRLELTVVGGATAMKLVPLVEGIEHFKVEYGIDNLPSTTNASTRLIGDSSVDSTSTAPADWTTVITTQVYLLARNTEISPGHTDDKTYTLGTQAITAANDRYKRHVYSAEIRLANPAGRREAP